MPRKLRLTGSSTVLPIREHRGGYVAEGPGFYIWDESLDEVVRTARLLARGGPAEGTRAARVRIARDINTKPTAERSSASIAPALYDAS